MRTIDSLNDCAEEIANELQWKVEQRSRVGAHRWRPALVRNPDDGEIMWVRRIGYKQSSLRLAPKGPAEVLAHTGGGTTRLLMGFMGKAGLLESAAVLPFEFFNLSGDVYEQQASTKRIAAAAEWLDNMPTWLCGSQKKCLLILRLRGWQPHPYGAVSDQGHVYRVVTYKTGEYNVGALGEAEKVRSRLAESKARGYLAIEHACGEVDSAHTISSYELEKLLDQDFAYSNLTRGRLNQVGVPQAIK